MFSRRKMNIVLLALAVAGSQAGAQNVDYVAQAKKKMSHVRDWSVQAAGKVRTKANNAYAVAREKALALYEKAKENKLMTAGMAYLALEASLWAFGKYTLFSRIFLLPGQLNAVNADLRAANADLNIANADLNIVNADLNIVNANLNIANQNNMNLTGQLNNAHQNNVNLTGELNNANEDLNIANQNNVNLTGRLNNANANIVNLNQQIVDLEDGELRMMDDVAADLDRHTDHIDRLNQNNRQAQQQAQQLQAQLERQNELDMLTFGIVFKNVGEQIEQLNGRIDNKEAQINQLNHDNQQAQQFQQTLQQQHQEALEALRNEHHDALQARINELINVQAVVIQKLRAQHQQALISEQTQHGVMTEQRINELQRNHAQELRNLTNKHQQDVNDECTRLDNVHQQAQRDLEAQHKQDVTNEINRLTNEHQQAQQALQEQLEQAQKQAQKQAEELQSKLTIANQGILEYTASVELEVGETNDERETLQKEVERLNLEIDDLNIVIRERDVQIKQLNQDIADRAQTQERLLREDREESDRRALEQGRAQVTLDQKHNAIRGALDLLDQELQCDQAQVVDSVGIIKDLMVQAREFVGCRDLVSVAYPHSQEKVSDFANDFNRTVTLTQRAIDRLVNHIRTEAEWLKGATKAMHFTDITADNFGDNLANVYADIHNCFTQLNNALGQLESIVGFSIKNKVIQSCLSTCDADSIVQLLGAMLVNSFDRIQQLGLQKDGNTIVVNSYNDAFNLYAHSSVANAAYQSYVTCCAMVPNAEELLVWGQQFEEGINGIANYIQSGAVQVQEPVNGARSALGNSELFNELNQSMISVSRFNLDQSAVNNFDLDAFLNKPIESVIQIGRLNQSLMGRSRLGNSSLFASSVNAGANGSSVSSVIDTDAFLKYCMDKNAQDWEDELNAMEQSAIASNKSFIASNANHSFLIQSISPSSSIYKSMNSASLSGSVAQFKNSVLEQSSCPFISSAIWGKQQEELAKSYSFDNRGRFSRVPHFVPLAERNGLQASSINHGQVRRNNNNNNNSPEIIVNNSIIDNHINVTLAPKGDKVKNGKPGGYSTLINEFGGESTTNDSHEVDLTKAIFNEDFSG